MKLPVVSGRDAIKALSKIGYYVRDKKFNRDAPQFM
jgi:predicted RNA binding protein YcfA (HicA-like mRNA interferase family)